MARKKKYNYWWLWAIGIFLIIRNVAQGGVFRGIALTPNQLAQMYRNMIEAGTHITYTVVRNGVEIPWHIDLARVTLNYDAVKYSYYKSYGSNLTTDLLEYFGQLGYIHLSEFVAELNKNGQVMTP